MITNLNHSRNNLYNVFAIGSANDFKSNLSLGAAHAPALGLSPSSSV